jgi:hypothetical protein
MKLVKRELQTVCGVKIQDSLAVSKPFNSISVAAGQGTRLKVSRAEEWIGRSGDLGQCGEAWRKGKDGDCQVRLELELATLTRGRSGKPCPGLGSGGRPAGPGALRKSRYPGASLKHSVHMRLKGKVDRGVISNSHTYTHLQRPFSAHSQE